MADIKGLNFKAYLLRRRKPGYFRLMQEEKWLQQILELHYSRLLGKVPKYALWTGMHNANTLRRVLLLSFA